MVGPAVPATTAVTPAPSVPPASSTPTPSLPMPNPPEPRFSYLALNTASIASIAPHITVNTQVRYCLIKVCIYNTLGFTNDRIW